MDPLSITAGIAGLLNLAGSVTSKGYVIVSKLKNRSHDINALVNEIAHFAGILVGVQMQVLARDNPKSKHEVLIQDDGTTIQDALESSTQILKEAKALFKSLEKANAIKYLLKDAVKKQPEQIIARIEHCKSFFILYLQIQNGVQSDEIERAVTEMKAQLKSLQSGQGEIRQYLDAQNERELARKRAEILQWLGPTMDKEHEDVCRLRNSGSAGWVLEREEIETWLSFEGSSYLWLSGLHGTGKTVIVSKVIETIESVFLGDQGVALAYHYCSFSNSVPLSSERVVGAIISQLLRKEAEHLGLSKSLSNLHDKYWSRKGYPTLEELSHVFEKLCQNLSRLFLVIDGLDELEDGDGIIHFLEELPQLSDHVDFKVFVASRPEKDLENAFECYCMVTITPSDNAGDLEQYVRSRVNQLELQDQREADELIKELVRRADGMFLWVVCQLDQLSRVRTAISTDLLRGLPKGLEQTFESGLLKLEDDDRVLALEILRWLMYSRRQLNLEELVEAIAVKPGMANLAQVRKAQLRRSSDVFEICGSLVHQSKLTGKLSLAHYSIYEWLRSPELVTGHPNQFYLDPDVSNALLLRTCIVYLSLDDYGTSDFVDKVVKALAAQSSGLDSQILSCSPFLDYACDCWLAHAKEQEAEEADLVLRFLDVFFRRKQNFESWAGIARYLHGGHLYPGGLAPIHVAALHGIKFIASFLLDHYPECRDFVTSDGRLPLHVVLESGNDELISLLVTAEALDATDKDGRSPLHIAVQSGNASAVTQLVSAGADVNASLPDGGTALSLAIENSWDELAMLLSEMASDKRLEDGRCLLHVAAQSGSLTWCKSLLATRGAMAMLHATDQHFWTPLHYAADNGHKDIIRQFLDAGAEVNPRDRRGWTPLHGAVRRRNSSCIAVLVDTLAMRDTGGLSSRVSNPRQFRQSRDRPRVGDVESTRSSPPQRSRMDPKYGGHYPEHPPRSDHTSNQASSAPISNALPSPLLVAVSESFTEGVRLLLKLSHHDDVGLHEMPACLEKAVTFADTTVLDMLLGVARDEEIRPLLPDIIAKNSEKTNTVLKKKWSTKEAHIILKKIVLSVTSAKVAVVKFFLANWPPPQRQFLNGLLYRVDCQAWSQDTKDLLILLIDSGGLDTENASGLPLLHTAIRDQNWDFAEFLIEQGCGDIPRNNSGETALLFLARVHCRDDASQMRLAHRLASDGADLFAVDPTGAGICHKAAEADSTILLRWVLDRGVPFDSPDSQGRTPLFIAVERGSEMVAKELLGRMMTEPAKIRELFVGRVNHPSILMPAVEQKKPRMLALLVQAEEEALELTAYAEQETVTRQTNYTAALCSTITERFRPGFDVLLPHVPDISHAEPSTGETPLHVAVRTFKSGDGLVLKSSLGIEADKSEVYYIEALLSKGVNVDAKTLHGGKTALDLAIVNGQAQAAKILLKHGAKPKGEHLRKAVDCADIGLVTSLLQHGASPTLEHLQKAVDCGNLELATSLLANGNLVDLGQLSMKVVRNLDLVVILLERGAQVEPGHLVLAAKRGHLPLLKKVLEVYPEDRDAQFQALCHAKLRGDPAITQVLATQVGETIDKVISAIPPDTEGGTLLHSAVHRQQPREVEILLSAPQGRDPGFLTTRDKSGRTALILAMSICHWESARLLIQANAGIQEAREWAQSTHIDMWVHKLEELIRIS